MKGQLRDFCQVDVFTQTPYGGNPAAIVYDATGLDERQMQKIAQEMNVSETAFIFPGEKGRFDFSIRYFTPREEVRLCGHGSVGAFFALAKSGRLRLPNACNVFTQRTQAGILPIEIKKSAQGIGPIVMDQQLPEFRGADIDPILLSDVLDIAVEDLLGERDGYPLKVVSTGIPDLLVPLRSRQALERIRPDFRRLTQLSKANQVIGIHAFARDTLLHKNHLHVRNFAPLVGIPEESATGTSNGALACYLATRKDRAGCIRNGDFTYQAFQGAQMERPSKITAIVSVQAGQVRRVRVGGFAVITLQGQITDPL